MNYAERKNILIEKHNQALQQAGQHEAQAVELRRIAVGIAAQVELIDELIDEGVEEGKEDD